MHDEIILEVPEKLAEEVAVILCEKRTHFSLVAGDLNRIFHAKLRNIG